MMLQELWKSLLKFEVRFGKYPDVVQYDDSNKFKNKHVNKLLDGLDILLDILRL